MHAVIAVSSVTSPGLPFVEGLFGLGVLVYSVTPSGNFAKISLSFQFSTPAPSASPTAVQIKLAFKRSSIVISDFIYIILFLKLYN